MKLLTSFFSSAATKRPVVTILVVLLLTGFFGYMAGQGEELSTSFGGELDTPEIQAQSKLGDYFQTSGSQSVFQIIMSGEDVLTVDGYLAWQEINKVVADIFLITLSVSLLQVFPEGQIKLKFSVKLTLVNFPSRSVAYINAPS